MAIPTIIRIFAIILCAIGIVAIIIINNFSRFAYEKKKCIIEDALFCLPMVFFIVALIIV